MPILDYGYILAHRDAYSGVARPFLLWRWSIAARFRAMGCADDVEMRRGALGAGKGNCAVCGEPLVYSERAQAVTCAVCGKQESGHSVCADGHYVCDACHRAGGVDLIMEACARSGSTDPVALAQELMADRALYPNGPEHHSLVGAVLLAAYRNAGGALDLDAALAELRQRSMQVPGGTCGFWGCCGAAVSAGQFYSIVCGSTPMTQEPWAATARLTSRIIGKLADVGGPRCCKRTSFTALAETVDYVADTLGVRMERPERIACTFMAGNAECRGRSCPYFPASA